jgi:hypothetical protein
MSKILLAGGFEEAAPSETPMREFVRALSAEIIRQGHSLLGGCQTPLDEEAAKAAEAAAVAAGRPAEECIISYVGKDATAVHSIGSVRMSQLPRWDLIGPKLVFPEPVAQADAVIIVGGWEGSRRAANWARLAGKPILAVAAFGLAAADIYVSELDDFKARYSARIRKDEYELLNTVIKDTASEKLKGFAQRILSLAERIITPRQVFVIMSFSKDPTLEDVYDTFKVACESYKFTAFKVDEHIDPTQKRIVPEIIEAIQQAAFVIADVSEPKPNVYYELGWAQAIGKPVIVSAKEGTPLPFDIYDVPTIYWNNQKSLRDTLKARIQKIAAKSGR